jgi:hypothetical protein
VTVEKVEDSGRYKKVYNLRVAGYHTYFVGDEDRGFAAWAHNSYSMTASQLQAWLPTHVQVPTPVPIPSGTPGQIVSSLPQRSSGASPVQGILVVNGRAYPLAGLNSQQPGFSAVVTDDAVRRQVIGDMGVTNRNYSHLEVTAALVLRRLLVDGETITSAVLYENQKLCEYGTQGCHPRMGAMLPQGVQLQVVWPDRRGGQTIYYQTPYTGGQTPPSQGPRVNAIQVN